MSEAKRYLVTSALPYANGPLHIGHIAGAYLPADVFVRYLRLLGKDVVYICGSDENGAAITLQAKKEGIQPNEIIDKYHPQMKKAFEDFQISFDFYHRTSSELHHKTASEFFTTLYEKGVFIEKESEQLYDEEFNQFLADRYVTGTCPTCNHDKAYGDQCENCGRTLSPSELINPKSTLSGATPVLRKTKHWYLPLDKDNDWLKAYINQGELNGKTHHQANEWKKNVLGQCNSWLNDGLRPRAITRDLDWGIKVPLENAEGKVLYVWLDAPIGYISATKQWAIENNKDWKEYWQNDDCQLYHFIGKDNIVFHTIIFQSLLKNHGDFILPYNVPGNEYMNLEGDKMSTSRRWSIQLHEYLEEFPDKIDELRYVLAANMPETKDSEFTWKDFQARVNNELVATLGNFINRVMVLSHKYYDGALPAFDESIAINAAEQINTPSTYKNEIEELINRTNQYFNFIDKFKFRDALAKLIDIASFGNSLLQHNEPWKKIKEDEEQVKVVMNVALKISAMLAFVAEPFLPVTSNKLKNMLNVASSKFNANDLSNSIHQIFSDKHQLNKAAILFEKIEDELVEKKVNDLKASASQNKVAPTIPIKDEIQYDDFAKLDFRVGTITKALSVPKADKLLQLEVDLGFETRTIVSGIAQYFNAEDIIGQQVTVVMNLAPRKLRGVVSNGMILMAENENGELIFMSPSGGSENGATVS